MDSRSFDIDFEMAYPILVNPKMCTPLATNCELADVKIASFDTEGIQLNQVETPGSSTEEASLEQINETNQLFSPYNESNVWIDPLRSPYVYNTCGPWIQEQYSVREAVEHISVEQHNTCITNNVYDCKEETSQSPVKDFECKQYRKIEEIGSTAQMDANLSYHESEYGLFLSPLPEEIMNETQSRAREEKKAAPQEDSALKQLMSSDIQSTSKQRKTVLFHGQDSHSIIDGSSPKLKNCDKCKQATAFRQQMVGSHTNFKLPPPLDSQIPFMCSDCGKPLKSQSKFKQHSVRQGDPDFECLKCRKVFASKVTLRVHMKIHNRKHPCTYCTKNYGTLQELTAHMKKNHTLYLCEDENCAVVSSKPDFKNGSSSKTDLNDHQHWKKTEDTEPEQEVDDPMEEYDMKSEDEKFGSRSNQEASGDFSRPIVRSSDKEERIREADSVKMLTNDLFLLTSQKGQKNHKICKLCLKSFDRIDTLKRHLMEHIIRSTLAKSPSSSRTESLLTCEVCQIQTFNNVDKYRVHLGEHAKLTIYKCTICDKNFNSSSNFSKHKKIHGDAHLQCDICCKAFYSKKMFTQHIKMHAVLAPVQCTYCNSMFHFESMLKRHMLRCAKKKIYENSLKGPRE